MTTNLEFEIFSSAPLQGKEKNFTQKFAGKLFSTILSIDRSCREHSYFFLSEIRQLFPSFSFFKCIIRVEDACRGEEGERTRFCEACIGGGNRAVPMWPRDYKRL